MEDNTTNAVKNDRKPIGMVSIVAYDNGDIELKYAGIEKEQLPLLLGKLKDLASLKCQ